VSARRVPPFHWWRTVFFLIPAVSLYTIVLGMLSLASTIVDRTGDLAHRCARAWAWAILKTTGVRVRVQGLEHIAASRTYVFAANHQSIYDIPIVFTALPVQLRIVAKESLGRIPFMGWHLRFAGHLLVDRQNPGAGIVRKMARLVGEHHSLIVFPEGTRSVDGVVGRFKRGPFMLALDAGVPIVPVSIRGSRHVMLKGQLMVCPADVLVTVHPPVETAPIGREGVRELATRVRDIVVADVQPAAAPAPTRGV
jgi:1-acyl-sn-glycerol-3-phosphate acyltransferase